MATPVEIVAPDVADPARFGSPTALGMQVGNLVFVSGMLAWDTERRIVGVGDIRAQTRKALENVEATLKAAGGSLANIVKINFYLTDIRDKNAVWDVRKEMFAGHRPASTLVEVSHLVDPEGKLEIDAIAYVERGRA
jgi:enamine deaminase RidA (YjgF/YER057c/UK114 family)